MSPFQRSLGLALILMFHTAANAQRLINWDRTLGELGLGYPVPIPVDTAEAFDGFRTYDGLHFKHQALMEGSENIEGMIVGQTRQGRDIWAYVFSDPDEINPRGDTEYSIMIQGGIHAREWQSPEVTTAVMEYLAANQGDDYWVDYLMDNGRFVILPVLNIDGFLQTQRYPEGNYLDSGQDPNSPRDGRMRRKNMLGVDEILTTTGDHLLGVDLNRNNLPSFGSGNNNTPDNTSLVHHGEFAASEPEIQAMQAAGQWAPGDRLRMYTDIHSFTAAVFITLSANDRRQGIQENILKDFSSFHASQPGNRQYPAIISQPTSIGSTDEYFADTYRVPAFTVELEPSFEGHGTDYNGLGRNIHDGFILPESEINRVRTNMATAFTMMHYNMAGAPSVAALRIYDDATGAIVYNAEWDPRDTLQQTLHVEQLQAIAMDRDYRLWISFDKPMRWRVNDEIVSFPGSIATTPLSATLTYSNGTSLLDIPAVVSQWLNTPGFSQEGYRRYRDDSFTAALRINSDNNVDKIDASTAISFSIDARDMVGNKLDPNPATVVDYANGDWVNLEDSGNGLPGFGGIDRTLQFEATNQTPATPFLIGQGQTAAWFDLDHNGEGFLIEMLSDTQALIYWFTYDADGEQRWFIGLGEVRPNELYFPELLVTSGGEFGGNFDPATVVRTPAGSAHFIFSDCDNASMRHNIDGRPLRQSVIRLTNPVDLSCAQDGGSTISNSATGSWFDTSHDGEGFVIEQIADDRVLIYWFTYDEQGQQAWIFGDGQVVNDEIIVDEALQLTGGRFGDEFDPADVIRTPWGQLRFSFDCDAGEMSYESLLPNFGSGGQSLTRLTHVQGLSCEEG